MSSAFRSVGVINKTTKFQHLKTQSYYDSTLGYDTPIPFVYENGVVDIRIQNNVENDLITDLDAGNEYSDYLAESLGGTGLATKLGPNFIRWLNDWVGNYYNSSVIDTFEVYIPATMTKVQVKPDPQDYDYAYLTNYFDRDSFGISSLPPSGTGFVAGNVENQYNTMWVFQSPLTIKFTYDGSEYYLTYQTTFAPLWND